MTGTMELSTDETTLTVRVPLQFRRVGGRKQIVAPDGITLPAVQNAPRRDSPLLRALGRAFRWRRMLEAEDYATLDELAKAERVNPSYVSRILRLTLLAPEVVEAIVEGRAGPSLQQLMVPFPLLWSDQLRALKLETMRVVSPRAKGGSSPGTS